MFTPFEPGAPVSGGLIPLSVPYIAGNAWPYVKECLDTSWVSSVGPYVDRFEAMVAERTGAAHAVATVNGTAALHTALLAVGVRADDEVLVSTLTFIATANAVRYVGAWPVAIDADPTYWQMDVERVREFLETACRRDGSRVVNRKTGRTVRAIVPVHVLGHPVDMDPLLELAREYGLVVVEDAAESLGASYRGRPVGTLGHAAAVSFNGNKIITCGGGGMLVTNDERIAKRARHLTTQAKDDPLEYTHSEVGYNYRLTSLQAALGCSQMELLGHCIAAKRAITDRYRQGFSDVDGLTPMATAPWAESVCWLFTMLVDESRFGMSSRQLLKELAARKIQARPLWQPMHRSAALADAPRRDCPVADRLNREALSLPSSVGLTEAEQQRVIDAVREVSRGAASRAA